MALLAGNLNAHRGVQNIGDLSQCYRQILSFQGEINISDKEISL